MGKIYRNGKTITPSVQYSDYKDMLQERIDLTNKMDYLFYFYPSENVDYISRLDTSKVISATHMFERGYKINSIPYLNTENVTLMQYMFYMCHYLTAIPQLNTSKVTNMSNIFDECGKYSGRLSIPALDTSNVINMSGMFRDTPLIDVPVLNTSNVGDMSSMFNGCEKITQIPAMDTSKVTNMGSMFNKCTSLTTIPILDTSKVTNMYIMFASSGIETIPLLDMQSVKNSSDMFKNCTKLKNLNLKNIHVNLVIGSKNAWGHLITKESLLNTIKELWDMSESSARTLTVSTTSKATLDDIYVKLITITDEMRAEDPYIDKKKPFEECESSDEGAMLIIDYATTQKNWTITA